MSKNTKKCGRCKKVFPVSKFGKDRTTKTGLRSWCKKCHTEYNKRYDRGGDRRRDDALKQKYGIDSKKYEELLEKQNGCCAICGRHKSEFKKRLAVDHSHETGEVRGLLCGYCNTRLGHIENILWVEKARQYLESYGYSV